MIFHFRKFCSDSRGVVAIIFAVALVVVIGVVGVAIDYSNLSKTRAAAQNMADAAALEGALAKEKEADTHLAVKNFVSANRPSALSVDHESLDVQENGASVSVHYRNSVPTFLSNFLGVQEMAIDVTATASTSQEKYVDFYFLLDTSGSMGIGASPADRAIMGAQMNCVFACHATGGVETAHNAGAKLRFDALKEAVMNLISAAQAKQTIPGQFRIGLYPFMRNMAPAYPLSSNFYEVGNAVNALSLDTFSINPYGSGGTSLENALQQMNSAIAHSGNGATPDQRSSIVFFVTDGLTDDQVWVPHDPWLTAPDHFNKVHPLQPAVCNLIKNRSITLSVMYIEYQYLRAGDPGIEEDFAHQIAQTNAASAVAPDALRTCASPGMFFQADLPGEIDRAMQDMFGAALRNVRVTQ
jgi:Flp pilus assembly protein TadG